LELEPVDPVKALFRSDLLTNSAIAISAGEPVEDDIPIYFRRETLDHLKVETGRPVDKEIGGLLPWQIYSTLQRPYLVEVSDYVASEYTDRISLPNYTFESWQAQKKASVLGKVRNRDRRW